ncbi:hypothetical protein SS1G_04903 [Sclerotinia sclerotiorum 1980 UF-70]|uniref:SMP-30/Gluconolactonase/LRE-like region domain-containing protein n=2 Tax=Sclerotinia sclerotiorum (strain ATCC 18683 / 1980 / Ss-1) TaxID=665079 RepID=A7EHW1_SCLS1|nr:hypothetical protein SS1G_04903 [Sclerotinia sclerotiorum 1980 UF-70]APA11496.1 hypothetical protein sscle_08g062660 [Sclerotinia sclerotiorum 1980 UF-70]EDO02427.1 hypothetical protein SS1G_04903 [Sclerotinia sclerotiorum 1980 UF-70]
MHSRNIIPTMAIATGTLAQESVYTYTADTISTLDLYNVSNLAPFQIYNESFTSILGNSPTITNVLNSSFPQFHEAGIFFSESTLFVTSNQYAASTNSPSTNNKTISITRLDKSGDSWSATIVEPQGTITLANGGIKYKDGLIICDQGSLTAAGGLVYMNATAPYETKTLINNYYGVEFNSPNDVHVTSDGALWFTDPSYGSWQGIRPQPQLPNQVYRYMPETNDIRVVADGIQEPNGITFSPDEKTAYITDGTGNATALTAPRAIYAYDVITRGGQPSLANKRIFAVPQKGLPDGIKTDAAGNVYAGCGDGVNVWNEGGILLGKIVVAGGSSNFILGNEGNKTQVWLLNEDKFWQASLGLVDGIDSSSNTTRVSSLRY